MEIQTLAWKLEDSLKRGEMIILACHCTVEYSGRAESYLSEGDRVIMIKSDSTLVVHQPNGSNPINYMKSGSSHHIEMTDEGVYLRSQNLATKEYLDIRIFRVYFFDYHAMEDTKSIELAGTEKDMADMIFKNPEMIEKGFTPLSQEEHTKFGFIDIFGYDKKNILTVIECKRYTGDPKAVDQLRRYVEKVKKVKGLKKVRGILACPSITASAKEMLLERGYEFVSVKPPKYLERYDKNQKTLEGF